MNKKIIHLFLFFLITTICLSPRFSLGLLSTGRSIDIRAEDIMLCFGLIISVLYILISGKSKFIAPPLFWPILSICLFGFFSILINILLGNIIMSIALFYFIKEIEFFLLFFIVFSCLARFDLSKNLMRYWLFFGLINIFWLIYVFIFNIRWSIYYGPNAFMEPQGPAPSGGFFALIFIFFFNLFIFYYKELKISKIKKVCLFILCVLPILGVMSSGSMANTLGAFFSIPISLFLLFKNKINISSFLKVATLTVLILGILVLTIYALPLPKKIISFEKIKKEYGSDSPNYRGTLLKDHLIMLFQHPEYLIFGVGIFGEAHMQYMRIILERGIIGLFLFFWLILSILKISYGGFKEKDDLFKKGLSAGLFVATISMLIMAIPNDVFVVTKPDEVYWFFTAMTMAAITAPKKEKYI